ncbi:MAG: efflux RND transporter permease subunit [Thermoguttaceae bacterium]|nr:efflux RND transporter permease subunit [Thermoguttaceae bacterium]
MFSRFFIDRPIFSTVVSLIIMLAGAVTYTKLPVAQFPDIVPPVVTVSATYTGADPQTIVDTVAIPIEQQVNGVDNMIYMSSTSDNGNYSLTVTFDIGTDPDMATVLTQNRVSLAEPSIPNDVTRLGIEVKKKSTNMLALYCLCEKERKDSSGNLLPLQKDDLYLSNYASIFIKDQLARVPGVGEATIMDSKNYSMRVWLDPDVLAERKISVQEISSILEEQNVQVASGEIGGAPVPKGQVMDLTITTKGRLSEVEDFENLVVRSDDDGRILFLKDIGKVELGKYSYGKSSMYNGRPASTLAIYQSPGANAIDAVGKVREQIESMKPMLDQSGLELIPSYDSTIFITESIAEVKETLYLAVLIVIAVVYVFLQDWRAALIPTLVIPVSLIGTFFLMMLFGFSMNTLTMFGLVLVIGIVVDDAIVVVENTQRILESDPNISPRDAAKKSMEGVTGPILATTCVLCSVFIPTTFISGMTGLLYTQFALTIAGAVVISSLCALSFSPALCAIFLRHPDGKRKNIFFRAFNATFDGFAACYNGILGKMVRLPILMLFMWFGLVAALYWGMKVMPSGFIPNEDQGVLFVDVRLPDGASLERTEAVRAKVYDILRQETTQKSVLLISGYSMLSSSNASNFMLGVINLNEWKERTGPDESAFALQMKLNRKLNSMIPEATILVFLPPPIMGIGTSGGLECEVLDRRGSTNDVLSQAVDTIIQRGVESGVFSNITSTFRPTIPQLYIDIDREKAKRMGIDLDEVFSSLQSYLGSSYINDFNTFQRVFHVVVQADGRDRQSIDQILDVPLLNGEGNKLTMRSIATVREIVGPQSLSRFNLSNSTMLTADLSAGQSTGTGMKFLEGLTGELPEGFDIDWTGMSYQQKNVGATVIVVFILAFLFGFLTLAAQYESWSAPLIIMMAVPLGVSGAILAVALRGLDVNIYTQIGLIIMIGLSAKNAILITEFARDNRLKEKMGIIESAKNAGRQRLRPIMMTSFAFILGVVPLAIATGAGANSRRAIGTAVCGGMLEETMIGIVVTPVLFVLLTRVSEWTMKKFHAALGTAHEELPDEGEVKPAGNAE